MVRSVLSRYLEAAPKAIRFRRDAHGRPFVDEPPVPVDFNLSHTRKLVMLAVRLAPSAGARVGVDVERMRPGIAWERIARRFFSPREAASLESLLAGGIEFASPDESSPRAAAGTVFELHDKAKRDW